jgi:glucuronate isomerase
MTDVQLRDPSRLFPADPSIRAMAADLFARVVTAPIISPHGHVPAQLLADDTRFEDPAKLLISSDHYVVRVLHSAGVDLADLGLGGAEVDPRDVWRIVAEN